MQVTVYIVPQWDQTKAALRSISHVKYSFDLCPFPVMFPSTPLPVYPGNILMNLVHESSSWTLLLGNKTQDTSFCSVITWNAAVGLLSFMWLTDLISMDAFLMINTSEPAHGNHKFCSKFEKDLFIIFEFFEIVKLTWYSNPKWLSSRLLEFFSNAASVLCFFGNHLVCLSEQRLYITFNYRICLSNWTVNFWLSESLTGNFYDVFYSRAAY